MFFLGRNVNEEGGWSENQIQSYIVMMLRQMNFIVHGDANGASKTMYGRVQAKSGGMLKGFPDLTVFTTRRPTMFELKLEKGRLSPEQRHLHRHMEKMGYPCHVVWAKSPADGLRQILEILG